MRGKRKRRMTRSIYVNKTSRRRGMRKARKVWRMRNRR